MEKEKYPDWADRWGYWTSRVDDKGNYIGHLWIPGPDNPWYKK